MTICKETLYAFFYRVVNINNQDTGNYLFEVYDNDIYIF